MNTLVAEARHSLAAAWLLARGDRTAYGQMNLSADGFWRSFLAIFPVLPLYLSATLGLGPARIGLLFGFGAVASTMLHPIYGRLVNRAGSRRMTMIGLVLVACLLPLLSLPSSYRSAIAVYVICAAAISMIITPSLAYMAEATSSAGAGSFGIGYGLYNMAWGAGLLGGPALSGFMFERMGFGWLMLMWAPPLVVVTWLLGRVQSPLPTTEEHA